MPSPGTVQLNTNVDAELKKKFKALCDREGISLARAITSFMTNCLLADRIEVAELFKSETTLAELGEQIIYLREKLSDFEKTQQQTLDRLKKLENSTK